MNSTLRHRRRPRANKRARPLCGCVCVCAGFLFVLIRFLPSCTLLALCSSCDCSSLLCFAFYFVYNFWLEFTLIDFVFLVQDFEY